MLKRALSASALALALCATAAAQKGTAEPGFYPPGYSGDTWSGEVVAVDNDKREITLTHAKGKKSETFAFVVPGGGFGWGKDAGGDRVLMFTGAYDKKAAAAPPQQQADLSQFMGRRIKVYYKRREKKDPGGEKVKYNEAVHIKFLKSEQ